MELVSRPKADYFELFGLSRRFGIDRAGLERKFYELSRKAHPDRFTMADPVAQRRALEQMSELNEAYRTLKDPALLRQYYLKLEGVEQPSEHSSASSLPMDLAESWFELQDSLMEGADLANQRIEEFEDALAQAQKSEAERLLQIESEIDHAVDTSGHAPREKLELLVRAIRSDSYLRSMDRDVDRIKKRIS